MKEQKLFHKIPCPDSISFSGMISDNIETGMVISVINPTSTDPFARDLDDGLYIEHIEYERIYARRIKDNKARSGSGIYWIMEVGMQDYYGKLYLTLPTHILKIINNEYVKTRNYNRFSILD